MRYYVKSWRANDAADVMVERLLPDRAGADEEPPQQQNEEPEPEQAVVTLTDTAVLDSVLRMGPGLGYNFSGTNRAGYSACYKWVAAEYIAGRASNKGKQNARCAEVGFRALSGKLFQLTGVYISYSTIYRAVQGHSSEDAGAPVDSPARRGRESPYPRDAEEHIVKWIKAMRAFKLAVFKCQVMAIANSQIIGCAAEAPWPNGVTDHWYYRFLDSHDLTTGTYRPLEISRAQWTTSKNMMAHYAVLEEVFLEAGVAIKNPDYDATKPYLQCGRPLRPGL